MVDKSKSDALKIYLTYQIERAKTENRSADAQELEQQLKAHEAEVEILKEYFDDKIRFDKSDYDFLKNTPKEIIDGLCGELQDLTVTRVKKATSTVLQDSKINRKQKPPTYTTKPYKIKTNNRPKKNNSLWQSIMEWNPFK